MSVRSLVPLLPYQAYLIRLGVLLTCFLMNLFGVDVVGKISGVLLVIVLAPFALIIGIGARYIQVYL
jgi:amino acid transporter